MGYDFRTLIDTLRSEGLNWGFYEDGAKLEDVRENSVSGQVISRLNEMGGPRAVGLLIAFAARRSLACWFLYCTDTRLAEIAEDVIQHWLIFQNGTLPISATIPIQPMEGDEPIVDCRFSDTSAASSAVAHAAKYARDRNLLDAMISLSHARSSFNNSPVGSVFAFDKWLIDYAIPIALQGREMTEQEAFANADYEPPVQLRRQR
jgi:hypothetical protein